MAIENIQPANPRDVSVYAPYYQAAKKKNALPVAISLYQKGSLEGLRKIEGGESIPFVASWNVSSMPVDITRCRLQFDGNAELSYELTLANFEFVDYLIDVIYNFKGSKVVDFSQNFYRKLLRVDE